MGGGGFLPWAGDVQGGAGLGTREGACRAAGVGAGNGMTLQLFQGSPNICLSPQCMSVHARTHNIHIYPAS